MNKFFTTLGLHVENLSTEQENRGVKCVENRLTNAQHLPQVLPNSLPTIFYRFDNTIKSFFVSKRLPNKGEVGVHKERDAGIKYTKS